MEFLCNATIAGCGYDHFSIFEMNLFLIFVLISESIHNVLIKNIFTAMF